ncbi:P-loop ATPase, Sll1717 family [Aeromonas caviae]
MKLKDIHFGSIDAKHDIEGRSPEEIQYFEDTFILPPNVDINDYLLSKKYYISGLKGTGKTALLRYIQIKAEKLGYKTNFILFKSDFDTYERKAFHNSLMAEVPKAPENSDDILDYDYEQAWRMYFYQTIVTLAKNDRLTPFQDNAIWKDFKEIIESSTPKKNSESLSLPRITKGRVELSKSPKLELEFETINDKTTADFSEYCKICDSKYKELTANSSSNLIFIDELEFRHINEKSSIRDIHLVRDLIVTTEKINQTNRKLGYNLSFILAVRTEVLYSVNSLGKEINKPLFDFGDTLAWHKYSADKKKHPLIKIIESRIISSEKRLGIKHHGDVWAKYFHGKFHDKDIREFAIDQTWYRPRDMVRLMGVLIKVFKERDFITQRQFDEARKLYSSESWVELCEELSASLTQEEIEAIARVLGRFKFAFNLKQFREQVNELANIYSEVDKLESSNHQGDLLKKLYDIGVIGNYIKGQRGNKIPQYAARGNPRVLLEEDFIVHPALKPYFSTNL